MDLKEITRILTEEDGAHICPICGTPFSPRTSQQKTCGAPDCKRLHHNAYVRERAKRLKEENPDVWRRYHTNANRKWRAKQKGISDREAELKDLQKRWEKQKEFEEKIAEYGHRYGEVSAAKVLATVPKIDTNLVGRKDNDDTHAEDSRE